MKELWFDFWSKKSAAVRMLRLGTTGVGTILLSGTVPFPPSWIQYTQMIGGMLMVAGPLITGRDK
jgi:hypothetical protein